jgi:hypothetical protein
MKMQWLSVLLVGLLLGVLSACVTHAETVAEHFDRQMKAFAKDCAKTTPRPGSTSCDRLKLKLADPLATEEGRFAHSIKVPNPVPEDSGYKLGMTSEQYFDHLCKTEAGEFIYKTVENVEGLYMMRPRKEASDYELEHLHVLEDPYGYVLSDFDLPQDSYVHPAMGKYDFLEMPMIDSPGRVETLGKYKRYYRDENAYPGRKFQTAIDGQGVFVPYIVAEAMVSDVKSRYGFTWRGVPRPHDRELGIAGGELVVLDLKTQEIVAVKRGFIRSGWIKNMTGIWWLTGRICSAPGAKREHLFIKEILKPAIISVSGKEK